MEDPILFTPGPVELPYEVLVQMAKPMISHRSIEFRRLLKNSIEYLKKLFGTENQIFILTASGTGAVETALVNLVDKDMKILVPVYGEFSRRFKEAAMLLGAKTIGFVKDFPVLEDFIELIEEHEDAEMLLLVYNDTCPGLTLKWLPEIVKKAKSQGLITIVDAISILGGDVLYTDKWGVDVVIGASQKCLMSPPGLSFISISDEAWSRIEQGSVKSYYLDLRKYRKFMERPETPFTPAVSVLFALNKALEIIIDDIGLDSWIEMHKERASAMYSGLEYMGFKRVVPQDLQSNTVISIYPPEGITPEGIIEGLRNKFRIFVSGGMGKWKGRIIRIGNMGYIKPANLVALILGICSLVIREGREVDIKSVLESVVRGVEFCL
ncbi:MAG: hypothetical protein DRN53_05650 [Thermoprotei archaeon]|nr:MAG: hypothetical protein DRN53_05650 [Thermoprotei archaeon]